MWGRSRCKMGSPDLHEFAAARMQNLYSHRSSALCALSVMLMHEQCVSDPCSRHAALMFYSIRLTITAVAKIFELGARIPFKGWRRVTLYEHFDTDEIICRVAANLCKSGEPFLH
jgi:hypothetical protein